MAVLDGGGPLYARVVDTLRRALADGDLSDGRRFPSERELATRLVVSRATIRRALAELAESGAIESQPGSGYVVSTATSSAAVGEETESLMSFSELAASRGLVATATLLSCEMRSAGIDEADLLSIAPGASLLHLERLRCLDGVPVAIDENQVPSSVLAGGLDIDWSTASLYDELEAAGHTPVAAEYTAEAVGADERQSSLLGVAVGAPLLATTTLSRDISGRAIESGRLVYRGDRYRFRATLRRRSRPGGDGQG